MNLNSLTAISPIDGRYRSKISDLDEFFSEYALIKYRVLVEIEYFIELVNLPLPQLKNFDTSLFGKLKQIYRNFTVEEAQKVKDIEAV
ncbi:MAG: adenylosuccinate lyase, partial [Marinilabiliales bacterium]